MAHTFRGGASVKHEKHRTEGKPIERMPCPSLLMIHTVQHIGAPNQPLVEKGDEVKKGQKLAGAEAFVSAPVHAPSSGIIKEIKDVVHPVLGKGRAIILETDGRDEWAEGLPADRDWKTMDAQALRDAVKEAGIVGLGGATFPTHVKITPPEDMTIEHLLINGAECEPYLTSDDAIMRERSEDIVIGIEILQKVLGAKDVAVGIENNKPHAIDIMTKACKRLPDCRVVALPSRYPQGAERSLIKALIGKWLPGGKLPMSIGVVVQNTTTCASIADAVIRGIPILEKVVTVSGECVTEPKNVLAPIGATWKDLLDFCGGLKEELGRLVMGGPMMGISQNGFDIPLVKGTSGLLALSKKEIERKEEGPCIRCGNCVKSCPMGLEPLDWPVLARKRKWTEAEEKRVLECVECGSCEYVCPANRHILQSVKLLKTSVRDMQREKK